MGKKIHTIIQTRKGRDNEIKGTIEELTNYFSYLLEIGNSWNRKINRQPKTIKALMKSIRASYDEKEGACYERTYVELMEN